MLSLLLLLLLLLFNNINGINDINNNDKLHSSDVNDNHSPVYEVIINNHWIDNNSYIKIEGVDEYFIFNFSSVGTMALYDSVYNYCKTYFNDIELCRKKLINTAEAITYSNYEQWMMKEDLRTISKFSTQYLAKTILGLLQFDVGIGTYNHNIINIICHNIKNCKLNIGKFCSISDNVKIILDGNHYYKRVTTYPFNNIPDLSLSYSNGPVIIGNDVWICDDVTILSNVTIGDGSILGAGSFIRKNVPPYAIVIGNPAIIVGYRFNDIQIEKLLQIKWWNKINIYNSEKYINITHDLMIENIDDFILKYSN